MGEPIAPIRRAIDAFRMLPGVGPKSAQRYAYHLIRMIDIDVEELSNAIANVVKSVTFCENCFDLAEDALCDVCKNPRRDSSMVCVVEDPLDVAAIERSGTFNGMYHVLHGALSPTNGISASDIRVKELLERLKDDTVKEVIIATNTNMDGEATAMYLQRAISPSGIHVSRIARGLPSGSDIEHFDAATLSLAMDSRTKME